MTGRLRPWVHASLIALAAPAVGQADHCLTKPCATAPPVKVVVEMSPPEITFKQAAPTTVKCPARPAPAPAAYHFPIPLPTQQPVYAPAPMYAPAYAPAYAPMPAPMFAPAAPAFAPAQCGSAAGFGATPAHGAGLGATAADLRAGGDALELQERAALQVQMSFIDRQYATLAERAKAAGLTPSFAPSAAPKAPPAAAPKAATIPPASPDVSHTLKQIQTIEAEIAQLQGVLRAYKEAIERQGK